MFNTIVGAGAASRYGSGSDQKMRLRFRNTDVPIQYQARLHCLVKYKFVPADVLVQPTGTQ
jgi:hypothetical protein